MWQFSNYIKMGHTATTIFFVPRINDGLVLLGCNRIDICRTYKPLFIYTCMFCVDAQLLFYLYILWQTDGLALLIHFIMYYSEADGCSEDELSCSSHSEQCYLEKYRCDGHIHCDDGSDEFGCDGSWNTFFMIIYLIIFL